MPPDQAPTRAAPPKRPRNEDVRGREWLTEEEVDQLRRAAGLSGRHGHRDATMILIAFTHALRASELVKLRWDHVDLKAGTLSVRRLKGSAPGTHPLRRAEVQALKKLSPEPGSRRGPLFKNERGGVVSRRTFHQVVARAGEVAGFIFPVHPHQLRHACGFKLANEGHDTRSIQAWMGHKNIQHTVRYTELAPDRFSKLKFWED
jgi:integrase